MVRPALVGALLCVFFAPRAWSQAAGAPVIATLSNSQTVTEGQSVSLSVSVNGTAPFSYQWRKEGIAISGATTGTLALIPVRVADAGSYSVVVSNAAGTVTSGPILLAVNAANPPTINFTPSNVSVTIGQPLNLSISISGTSPFTYEWRRNGTVVATNTTGGYTVNAVSTADAGTYTVVVTNIAGSATSGAISVSVTPLVAPTITFQPSDRALALGDFLDISVGISGSSPLTYQWAKDGVAISGATNSTFGKSNFQATDVGNYTVTASNSVGSVTSNAARVTLRPAAAPSISSTSSNATLNVGGSTSFSISLSGTAPFTYQWSKDGVPVAGATSSSLSITNAQLAHVGAYTVTATNSQGSATSRAILLALSFPQPPTISRQPASLTLVPGDSTSLSITVSGASPLSYQWRKDGNLIPNATNSSYSLPFTPASSDAGVYSVTVSNSLGTASSDPAFVEVLPPGVPAILAQPASQTVTLGGSISISAEISAPSGTTFQWRKDGTAITGATGSSFSKSVSVAGDAGDYTLVMTNVSGTVTSSAATLTVVPDKAPVITGHPRSSGLLPGESFGLDVSVRTSSSTTFQWRRDGAPIAGATSSSYFVSNAQPTHAGTYDVVITNPAGSATSRSGTITVETTRPLITSTSGSVAASPGGFNSLQVSTSQSNVTFQWRKDGAAIPNATSATYSISPLTTTSFGTYTAVATASNGTSATSAPIVVELLDSGVVPGITRQPAAQTRAAGATANFNVTATGEQPLTYQWRKDDVAIPGATSSGYSVSSLTASSAGDYTVVISNRNGTVTSKAASLVIISAGSAGAPVIRTHPISIGLSPESLSSGSGLNVALTSSVGVTYQWRKNDVIIPGATSSSISLSNTSLDAAVGRYGVVVTNAAGSVTSRDATVTALRSTLLPGFTGQLSNLTVLPGSAVSLAPTLNAALDVTFQWRRNGTPLANASSASLVLENVQPADAGVYTLIASNSIGAATSTPATLTIQAPVAGLPVISAQPRSLTALPGTTVVLSAGVAASPAATFQWRKDGVAIAGATNFSLTLPNASAATAGRYLLVATNSFGSTSSAEAVVTLGAAINFGSFASTQSGAAGSAFTLAPNPQSTAALTFQWKKNGVAIPGATNSSLNFAALKPSDAGSYTLVATNRDGSLESAAIVVSVTSSPFAGVYFGTFGTGDSWAMHVTPEGVANFIGAVTLRNVPVAVIARNFRPQTDGTFNVTATAAFGGALYVGEITGAIAGTTVVGQLSSAGVGFSGAQKPAGGATAAAVGYYQSVALGATLGETHLIAAADGTVQLVSFDASAVRASRGQIGATGAFSVVQPNFVFSGNAGVNGTAFSGTYQLSGGPVVALAPAPEPNGLERLANVSTRGVAGSGARTLIAGFVITGSQPKDVLVRGVGPALTGFGVQGALPNPRLRIFSGSTALFENDDWSLGGLASQISSATVRLGAFPLNGGSADSALLVRLSPGSYTAQVSSDADVTGVALVEVYDASTSSEEPQKLINLSTRGDVGTGTNILIVGLVVTGNAPKKILVRGVGPALGRFGVTGALADPQLQLYRGNQLLRENDNWSSGADATLIAEAAAAVGAFDLPSGSRDAALLLYLAPGSYTAQISGVGNTTGVGLIEVYEVP